MKKEKLDQINVLVNDAIKKYDEIKVVKIFSAGTTVITINEKEEKGEILKILAVKQDKGISEAEILINENTIHKVEQLSKVIITQIGKLRDMIKKP